MSTTYKVATGLNNQAGFVDIDPQPKTHGVQTTRRTFAAAGNMYEEGPFIEFLFNILPDEDAFNDVLAAFGLDGADSANVTIQARNQYYATQNYNGLAIRPQMKEDVEWSYFPRNVVILVRNLEEVA